MRAIIYYILFNILAFQNVFSQDLKYSYGNISSFDIEKYFEKITDKQLNQINDDYKKQKKEFYHQQLKNLKKQLKDSTYIFNDFLSSRIQTVFDEIYKSNPELKDGDFKFFIDKSLYPNAAAYGNGLFTINLGLLTFFDSEDELAYVICHELAHHFLFHIKKNIDNYVSKANSKEFKTKVDEINGMNYRKKSAGVELLRDINFELYKFSRASELEADSKGFYYFSKTKYNKEAAITALKKLGNIENRVFEQKVNWALIFNLDDYRFNEILLEKEESLFNSNTIIDDTKWDKDSIKSHPDIKIRIDNLNTIKLDSSSIIKNIANQDFNQIKEVSEKLSVLSALDSGKLDLALYVIATNINKYGNEEYFYKGKMAKVLKKLFELKKNHSIGDFVPHENNISNEIYLNDIRRFIHNIDLYELKKMGINYSEYYSQKNTKNTDLNSVYLFFKNN